MGAKDISKTMRLKDGVSGTLKHIENGTVRYKKRLRDLENQGNKTWKSIRTGVAGIAGAVVGFLGVQSAISFLNNAAEEAKAATEAQTKLIAVMKNVKGVTDAQVQSLSAYADQLQKMGVVEGDTIVAGVQQVGTFQLQAKTIKTLMPGMADLLAQQKGLNATQGDAVAIGNLIGKAMTGQATALKRVGISFTDAQAKALKFGNEQQRAAVLSEVLKQNVGGVNAALAQTDQGKIQQANNAWGDMKEIIGGTVLMIKGKFAQVFMSYLPQIQSGVQSVADSIQKWAEGGGVDRIINGFNSVVIEVEKIWNIAAGTYNFIKDNWSLIGPIVYGIAGGFVAYKIALMGAATWTAIFGNKATFASIKTAIMGTASLVAAGEIGIMTAAQRLFNAALSANPIGVVITLLGLLVLAGTYVVQNWEQIKLFGMNTWNFVVGAAEWAVNKYFEFANFMIKVYKFAWDSIEFAGKSIWNGIISAGEAGVNSFIDLINTMVSGALDGINSLIRGANKVSNKLGGGNLVSEITFGGLKKANFSGAKINAQMPKWDSDLNLLPKVDFGGAKFGEDSIMDQTKKAQAERAKKKAKSEEDLTKALASHADALNENTAATGANTMATNKNSATLNGNQSGTDIADMLLSRIERHLYAT